MQEDEDILRKEIHSYKSNFLKIIWSSRYLFDKTKKKSRFSRIEVIIRIILEKDKVDGSIFQVLYKDERADQNSGINSRSTVSRIKRAEKIRNEARVKLSELMKSRTKQGRIQTFELRRI
jgi:hypothetical protein